jgi:hypothetical protein
MLGNTEEMSQPYFSAGGGVGAECEVRNFLLLAPKGASAFSLRYAGMSTFLFFPSRMSENGKFPFLQNHCSAASTGRKASKYTMDSIMVYVAIVSKRGIEFSAMPIVTAGAQFFIPPARSEETFESVAELLEPNQQSYPRG